MLLWKWSDETTSHNVVVIFVVFVPVLQLVKSHKMPVKLVIVVETEKEKIQRKEFVFDNTKVTEAARKPARKATVK